MARKRKRKGAGNGFAWPVIGGGVMQPVGSFLLQHGGVIILCIIIIGGIIGLREYCYSSPFFKVSTIDINATSFFSRAQLLNVAAIEPGANIFEIDLRKIARRLEHIPRIKRAAVMRTLPDIITIRITERIEFAQVKVPFRNKYYLIDREGYILNPVLKSKRPELVVIDALFTNKSYLAPGDFFYDTTIENAFRLIHYMKTTVPLPNETLSTVIIDHGSGLTMKLADGIKIKMGKDIDRAFRQMAQVKDILSAPRRNKIEYIDLRFKDIAVKRR